MLKGTLNSLPNKIDINKITFILDRSTGMFLLGILAILVVHVRIQINITFFKTRKCACNARYVPLQVIDLQVKHHYYSMHTSRDMDLNQTFNQSMMHKM